MLLKMGDAQGEAHRFIQVVIQLLRQGFHLVACEKLGANTGTSSAVVADQHGAVLHRQAHRLEVAARIARAQGGIERKAGQGRGAGHGDAAFGTL
jgi:hypothetical protein